MRSVSRTVPRLHILAALLALLIAGIPAADSVRAAEPTQRIVLIDNSERQHGHTPLAPLWTDQIGRRFVLREHGTSAPLPGQNQDFRLTADILAGNDLVILTGFSGSATVGDRTGNREQSYDLSADEIGAIERYVRDGGNLLVIPMPMGRPNNLAALLARFGLDQRADEAHYLDTPAPSGQPAAQATQPVVATLDGRTYSLLASQWLYPLHSLPDEATVIASDANMPLVAEVRSGAGRVVYFGLQGLADGRGYGQAIFAAENPSFFLALLAHASGTPAPAPDDLARATWELRAAALRQALYGGAPDSRPAWAEWAARLQLMAASGQRCDLGPGCVAWTPTTEQRSFLEQHRAAQDAMMVTFAQLEDGVRRGAWATAAESEDLERRYDDLRATLATEQAQQQAFADLYRRQGGAYPRYPDENPLYALAALGGTPLAIGVLLIGIYWFRRMIRRRAPGPQPGG